MQQLWQMKWGGKRTQWFCLEFNCVRRFMVFVLCFQMVFLPESCDFIGEKRSQFVDNAEPANGETVRSFCQMAEQNKVWLSLGGILEKVMLYICIKTYVLVFFCNF
jgi:hypothetical protein